MINKDDLATSVNEGLSSLSKKNNIQVKIITDIDEFDMLSKPWHELVKASDVSIFQTFEWNRTWWKHFGSGKELYIITVFKGEKLITVVPLFIDTIKMGEWTLNSCLRFIGSSVSQPQGEDLRGLLPYSDYLDVIVHPDYTELLYQIFIDYFKNADLNNYEVLFEEVPQQSFLRSLLLKGLDEFGIKYAITNHSVCPIITLEDDWQEYLDRMSGNSRYKVRKFLKKAYGSKHKVFDIERVNNWKGGLPLYEKLVELHQKRWNKAGYPGAFIETRYYNFLKEISRLFISRGWAELVATRTPKDNDECVAVDLIFKFKKDVSLVHRAFDVEAETSDESPGNVLLYDSVKNGISENYNVFDFLRGAESYKFRSANSQRENKRIHIWGPNPKRRFVGYLAQKYISYKRRLYLEYLEAKTIFQDKNTTRGIRDYLSFLKSRV